MNKSELILKTIDQDIALCQSWAAHWQAMAITGVAKNKKMFHGTNGPEFTDEEKIEDAIKTSATHLIMAYELINQKKAFLSDATEEEKWIAKILGPARM